MIEAKIPVVVVSDIDLFNGEYDFKNLIDVLSGEKTSEILLAKRNKIATSINESSEEQVLTSLKNNLKELLEQLENKEHSFDGAKGAFNRIRSEITKWKSPKEYGIDGFPKEVQNDVKELISELKEFNIFIVPVGELEGWMDVGTKRKNKWIIKALNEILKNNASEPLKDFVKELIEKVNKNVA